MPIRFCLILGAFLVSVLMWVDRACISAAKSSIAADLQFSDQQMAWVMGAFSLGYALFQVPSGRLADRFGARIVMTAVCLAWSLLTAMTGFVREFYSMLLLRFAFGAGEAGGYPTLAKAYYAWLPMGERGIANSISFSGGRLGAAFAMPAVVYLIQVSGTWQRAFLLFGLIGILFSIAWYWLFRDTPESHFAVSSAEREHIVAHRQRSEAKVDSASGVSVPDLFRSKNLWLLVLQYIAHNFTFFFTVTWFFPYMKSQFQLSDMEAAYYASAPLLMGVLGNWLAGSTMDWLYRNGYWVWSRRWPALVGFALSAIGMTLCVQMNTPLSVVCAMCIAIFGSDMILSPSWSTCLDIGGKNAGTLSGAMNMMGNLGAFCTSLAFPYLRDWYGSHELFFYMAAAFNLLALGAWFKIRPNISLDQEIANTKGQPSK
jgi:MFS transporter, ACS family, glucarate transporter